MTKEEVKELARKIEQFGLSDLNKLAPIGNLGYMNGWYPPFYGVEDKAEAELFKSIYHAYCEQKKDNNWTEQGHSTGYRQTDHHTYCPELGLRWSVDSGD